MIARQYADIARADQDDSRTAYRIDEVARRWGLEYMGVYRMIKRGDLPSFQPARNGAILIPRHAVEELEKGQKKGEQE